MTFFDFFFIWTLLTCFNETATMVIQFLRMRVLASFAISVNVSRFSNSTPRNPISRRLRIFCCINKLLLQPKYGNFYSPIQQHTDCRFSFFTSSVQVHFYSPIQQHTDCRFSFFTFSVQVHRTGNFPNLILPIVSHPLPHSHPIEHTPNTLYTPFKLMRNSVFFVRLSSPRQYLGISISNVTLKGQCHEIFWHFFIS